MTWKLTGYSNCAGSHCEVCGTGITHNWFITDGTNMLRVGTECMFQLTGNPNFGKNARKHLQAAQTLYRKSRQNYSENFRAFWLDYYINAKLTHTRVPLDVRYVYECFYHPYNPDDQAVYANDDGIIPY